MKTRMCYSSFYDNNNNMHYAPNNMVHVYPSPGRASGRVDTASTSRRVMCKLYHHRMADVTYVRLDRGKHYRAAATE